MALPLPDREAELSLQVPGPEWKWHPGCRHQCSAFYETFSHPAYLHYKIIYDLQLQFIFLIQLQFCQAEDMDYLDDLLRNISGWDKADPNYLSIVDNNR